MIVCVLGRGKVGTALARAAREAGLVVHHLKGHPPWRRVPAADLYLLAVPDAALREVGLALAPRARASASVLHCAGARSHEELAGLREHGISVGVMHPLVSFAARRRPPRFAHTTFVLQGDLAARRRARHLVRALGAHPLETRALGPAYHAAAALVANASAALTHAGAEILERLGFPPKQARRALAGLLASVADNVANVGLPGALTGPVARGDARTVAAHLDALERLSAPAARAYASVQPLVLACAEDAGLSAKDARRIRALLAARAQRKT